MRYYQQLLPPKGLGNGYVALLDAIDAFTARGMLAEAELVRKALQRMWREYERLSTEGARKADTLIRGRIRSTAVRPPTSGRMEAGIVSRPIPTTWPSAAMGIADLDELDKAATNPDFPAAGPYWRTQEYGYAGHVGRRVPGYFMPGRAKPSAAQFRVHPFFEQAGSRGGKAPRGTPAMVIQRPIEARHFLRDGTDDLIAWRRLEMSAINRRAISTLARI